MVEYCIIILITMSMVNFINFGGLKSAIKNIYIFSCARCEDHDIILVA